jgi:hypothetical protein
LEVSFYVDGNLFGDRIYPQLPGPCDQTCAGPTTVGDDGYLGNLGKVYLYPEALDDAEVNNLFNTDGCNQITATFCQDSNNPTPFLYALPGHTVFINVTTSAPAIGVSATCTYNPNGEISFTTTQGAPGDTYFVLEHLVTSADVVGINDGGVVDPGVLNCQVDVDTGSGTISASQDPAAECQYALQDLILLQVDIFYNIGSCTSQDCVDVVPGVDNVTVRVAMTPEYVSKLDANHDATTCTNNGGKPQGNFCFTPIDPDIATNWNYTNSQVFRSIIFDQFAQDNGFDYPTMLFTPSVYAPNVWPNEQNFKAVSTVIDCSNAVPTVGFRFAYLKNEIGPCYYVQEYNLEICSNIGKELANNQFRDINENVLPPQAIHKDGSCP